MPHLKKGCIKDFKDIMGDAFNDDCYNKTEQQYHFGRNVIEFFGADESAKVRGPRREILYINEANNVPWETARNLDVRTSRFIFADWNPVSEFWAYDNWKGKPENAWVHSTYLDAKWVLPIETVKTIESYRLSDPNWWHIYGEGMPGKVTGLVYPSFEQAELPEGGQTFYGLDFGYSNDPSVLVQCVIKDGGLYCKQLIYGKGFTNDALAIKMTELGIRKNYAEIFADSAEPKSIQEIYQYNFNIKGCPKGADSVEHGHQRVREYKQFWTPDSLDCIKEQRNFMYVQDKDGNFTDKTNHLYSHGMDARRYGLLGYLNKVDYGFGFSGDK